VLDVTDAISATRRWFLEIQRLWKLGASDGLGGLQEESPKRVEATERRCCRGVEERRDPAKSDSTQPSPLGDVSGGISRSLASPPEQSGIRSDLVYYSVAVDRFNTFHHLQFQYVATAVS